MLMGGYTEKTPPSLGETSAANQTAVSVVFGALRILGETDSPSEAIPVREIAFVKVKKRPTLDQIRRVKGKYRNVLSPTEEFLARKRLDLELES